MSVDPLHFAIALTPLAAYFAFLGMLNLRRRPFITRGTSDLFALGIALSGFAIVGPMELFMPAAAAIRFGPYVWLFLIVFYSLCISLAILLTRPRIVFYNLTLEELRPVLASIVQDIDAQGRWAGESLLLPSLGVQLHLDTFPPLRTVSLVSSGTMQNLQGWDRLQKRLAKEIQTVTVKKNNVGYGLLALALIIAFSLFSSLVNNPIALAEAVQDMLM